MLTSHKHAYGGKRFFMRLKDTIGISFYLRSAEHELRNSIDEILKKLKLTSAQYSVLSLCEERPNLTNADLARELSVTPQTMSRIMKNLEKNGHIQKDDGSEFSLTAKGAKVICKAHEEVNDIEKILVKGLSKKEVQELKDVLQHCFQNMKKHL
jgi:DNA-binding MarR family transcriptional regulator